MENKTRIGIIRTNWYLPGATREALALASDSLLSAQRVRIAYGVSEFRLNLHVSSHTSTGGFIFERISRKVILFQACLDDTEGLQSQRHGTSRRMKSQ